MTCIHNFVIEKGLRVCEDCGLEDDPMILNSFIYSYAVKITSDDVKMLVDDDIKSEVIDLFDALWKKANLRGEGKRALIAACYNFICLKKKIPTTTNIICGKFNIKLRKYMRGIYLFLKFNPEYSQYQNFCKISHYVDMLMDQFEITADKRNVLEYCEKNLDDNKLFVNIKPYSVCACFLYLEFLEKMNVKKSQFIKSIKVSDSFFKRIIKLLKG